MREKLIQYVDLLFAGAPNCQDIKQEILQNTLDRYDDLIADGKVPEAAYRLAIAGIGDINKILSSASAPERDAPVAISEKGLADTHEKRRMRALAVGLYILSPVPLFLLEGLGLENLGLCLTLVLVAIATVLMLQNKKTDTDAEEKPEKAASEESELQKSIHSLIWVVGLVAYFALSFTTSAWYVTWLIFPIIGAVQGLVRAILDLMEVNQK